MTKTVEYEAPQLRTYGDLDNLTETMTGTMTESAGGSKSSSTRYKDNITPLSSDPAAILELESKEYYHNEFEADDIGFIAEEVAEVAPELVAWKNASDLTEMDNEALDMPVPDGIHYDKLPMFHHELLKDLKAENEELRDRLTRLEEKVDVRDAE